MKKLYAEDIVRILHDIVSVPRTQQLVSVEGMEEGHQWKAGIHFFFCYQPNKISLGEGGRGVVGDIVL